MFGRRCRHIVIVDRVTGPAPSAITVAYLNTGIAVPMQTLIPEADRRQPSPSGDPAGPPRDQTGGVLTPPRGPLASTVDIEPAQPLAGAIGTAIGETP